MPLLCQTRILLLGFIHYITFISLIFPMRKTVCCFRIWVLVLLFQTKSSINGACSTYFLWIDIFRMLSSTAMPSRLQLVSQIFGIMSSIHFYNCFALNQLCHICLFCLHIFFVSVTTSMPFVFCSNHSNLLQGCWSFLSKLSKLDFHLFIYNFIVSFFLSMPSIGISLCLNL